MNINIHDVGECVLLDNIGKNTIKIQPTEIAIGTFGSDYATEIEVRGILRDPDWRPNNFHFVPVEPAWRKVDYNKLYGAIFGDMSKIKDVIFNDPATIVFWADGTKTVVKCQDGDIFDPEKGLAMAITKKALGNKGNYCNELKKWLPEKEEPIAVTIKPFDIDEMSASIKRAVRGIENACKKKKE